MELNSLRKEIDDIDSKLVQLLNEMAKRVLGIARIKRREKMGYYSPGRERSILNRRVKEN